MAALEKEYFFVLEALDDRLPSLMPDADTAAKPYSYEAVPLHSKPLMFSNGAAARQRKKGIAQIDPPPPILFDGSNLLVKDSLRERLLTLEIPSLVIQPAIYVDDKGHWNEDYWYLTFVGLLDCWARDGSSFEPLAAEAGEPAVCEVSSYALDSELLSRIPLADRRLFKMGGTTVGFVVVHESIAALFRVDGVVLVPVSDYGVTYP